MRIVDRTEFLQMPTPFMYIECDEYGNTVGELSINCGNIKNRDCVINSCVLEPEFKDSSERFDMIDKMMADSKFELPVIDDNATRYSLYNDKQLFIVYSEKDFALFVETMQKYLKVYNKNESITYISE